MVMTSASGVELLLSWPCVARFELPIADLLPEEYRDSADDYEKGSYFS